MKTRFREALPCVAFAAMLAFGAAAPVASADNSVSRQIREQQRQGLGENHRRSIERRENLSARGQQRNLYQFQDSTGSVTFTNRPERYEGNRDYEQVAIRYDPIAVPRQYQRFSSPTEYTNDTVAGLISRYARIYRLDEDLVYAVIRAESNFDPNAVSRAGASGLMQLMPGTAAEMGVTKIFDPAQNIAGGTQYLSRMLDLFNGDIRLALAGYNAGPENVRKYGGIPPFKETQTYVKRVLRFQQEFRASGTGMRAGHLAQVRRAGARPPAALPGDAHAYVVHFHSGLTQPADNVVDKEPYYYIEVGKRSYPVRKELVKEIAGAA